MSLSLNIRHLEQHPVQFEGTLDPAELNLDRLDELIHPVGPVRYEFQAARQERGILLQGWVTLELRCDCARCLEPFQLPIRLDPWICLLPWEGEEAVIVRGDCVDLTPYLRDDMVLALPQRPLCKPECRGLQGREPTSAPASNSPSAWNGTTSAWQELDRLSF